MLRLRGDHDSLAESESLARRAIAAQPNDPNTANFCDTLARVLLREGRTDEAIAAFAQGDSLDPRNFSVLIGMADACAHAHRVDDAIRYLARIDGLLSSTQLLPPNLQTELADARAEAAKPNNPVSASSPGN
jgi:predicted Zn-dependent protease